MTKAFRVDEAIIAEVMKGITLVVDGEAKAHGMDIGITAQDKDDLPIGVANVSILVIATEDGATTFIKELVWRLTNCEDSEESSILVHRLREIIKEK